ncbi:MAG: hypothetical protein WA883_18155 [Phormidesmis sp.]
MTKNIALEPRPTEKVSESYSDELMDDLFGDVDRILAGDSGECEAIAKSPAEAYCPGARTVQLPSNFTARSAADIYRATMAASRDQASNQSKNQLAPSQQTSPGYHKRGRPMTAFHGNPAQSGNFQSAVIQSSTHSETDTSTATIDVQPNAHFEENFPYPSDAAAELTSSLASSPDALVTLKSKASKLPVSLPFLLIGAAGISMAGTLGIWALGHSDPGGARLLSFNTEASAAELPRRSDEAFLVYLQQALNTISANHNPSNQTVAILPGAAPASSVPAVPQTNTAPTAGALPSLPGANASAANGSVPNVIERVFVPVYQNERTNNPVAVAPAAPIPSNQTGRRQPTVPVPAPVAAAAALPAGAAVPAASLPTLPAGNTALPTPPVTTAAAPTNSAAAAIVDTTPAAEQVLVGVLNLGSRSAALFDVDGNSQRAYVGDRIGTSDWSLVSVNGQDVVIRRNGEVRSVYIGQRF